MTISVVKVYKDGNPEPKQLIDGQWLPIYRDEDGYYHPIDERVIKDLPWTTLKHKVQREAMFADNAMRHAMSYHNQEAWL